MNYFELYQIPLSFKPDQALVKKRFYQLSRKYHPDFYTNESADEKEKVLELSAMVNKAYQTFQHTDFLMKYILQEKGLLVEEEKYQLSSDFLMEVMDINEQLMDADSAEAKEALRDEINHLQNKIYAPIEAIMAAHQEDSFTQEELLQVKEYYFRKKYIDRILAEY